MIDTDNVDPFQKHVQSEFFITFDIPFLIAFAC